MLDHGMRQTTVHRVGYDAGRAMRLCIMPRVSNSVRGGRVYRTWYDTRMV
jgi:hypothetical protein